MFYSWVRLNDTTLVDSAPLIIGEKKNGSLWRAEKSFHYFMVKFDKPTNFSCVIDGFRTCDYKLYQVQSTLAHIGRGTQWGNIPSFPTARYHDILKPYYQEIITSDYQLFCLEIESQQPGIQKGSIHLVLDNCMEREISLQLDVLEAKISNDNLFGLELWQYPFTVARYYGIKEKDYFGKTHLEKIKESLIRYRQAGGTVVVTTILHDPWNHQTYDAYPSLIKWQKTAVGFDFDFTWFDRYVELNFELGISEKIKCFSMLPWEEKISYWNEEQRREEVQYPAGSKEWQKIWGTFLQAFVYHLEEKGWFHRTYIAIDERPAETLNHVLALLEKYPNQTGERLKLSCAMDYQNFDETLLDQIADVSIGQSHLGSRAVFNALCESRRQKGLFTSIYNCVGDYPSMFLYSNPYETQWVLWNAVSYGSDGFLRWALDAWVENPLENASHWYWESGDPFLIYPSEKEETTAFLSIRYQQLIEGMNQINKYKQLKREAPDSLRTFEKELATLIFPKGMENEYGARVALKKTSCKEIQQAIEKMNAMLNQCSLIALEEEK